VTVGIRQGLFGSIDVCSALTGNNTDITLATQFSRVTFTATRRFRLRPSAARPAR
jgi:hypothetical protein